MTAVANPPSFANINRPAWANDSQSLNGSGNQDDVRSMFAPRKSMQRTNSSSSINSNTSNSSTSSTVTVIAANAPSAASTNGAPAGSSSSSSSSTPASATDANGLPITALRKRPLQKAQWSATKQGDNQADFIRSAPISRQQMGPGPNGVSSLHQLPPFVARQPQNGTSGTNGANGIMARPQGADGAPQQGQPVLYLVSLNGTFERKTISVPFIPDTLRIGRQTNRSTTPDTVNGYFDSKVLSRQHAEIWADRQGKIWIRDIKSSNGTFVNGTRLSAENRESEPHELQTNDHLELGIDIVSEDQKSVVHHKVAAKVEHAGFISTSSNLLDMNFGDLDPANGAIMGPQMNNMPLGGRNGSQASLGPAGRMAPISNMAAAQNNGLPLQRGLWLTGPSTEAIVKKIHQEMRNAKQQSLDLQRTQDFIKALLSKDDIRNEPNLRSEAATDALKQVPLMNGNLSFRGDAKARFSDPPAPPPQQPLPEKPDVPSLKRGTTERPKTGPAPNTSPVRPDVPGQVVQLTDALNTAKREIVTQHSRMRELEDKLHREQEARRTAEELARRLEEAATIAADASALQSAPKLNGTATRPSDHDSVLEDAFEPVADTSTIAGKGVSVDETCSDSRKEGLDKDGDAVFRARIESLMTEMDGMRKQLQLFQERAEKAESERDADRETLAEMITRIRQRDEENAKLSAAVAATAAAAANAISSLPGASSDGPASRSLSRGRSRTSSSSSTKGSNGSITIGPSAAIAAAGAWARAGSSQGHRTSGSRTRARTAIDDLIDDEASLSRTNTITPGSSSLTKVAHDPAILRGIPYASMVGVVLFGMGLMAYLNGWQPTPARLDR